MPRILDTVSLLLGACLVPAAAAAAPVELCAGQSVEPGADGRMFGHLSYGEAASYDLVVAPPGFSVGQTCRVHRSALADLTRLLSDADQVPEIAGTLRGISCFRGIEHQRRVFCARVGGTQYPTPQARAQFVAPPGYSEHATGYAIDFGVRPSGTCRDVDSCIIGLPAGKWLLANARRYGFELSFPAFNKQGVTWEPWHFRWVGTRAGAAGAAAARAVVARARREFAADPAVVDPAVVKVEPKPVVELAFPRLPGI